jgi:hypothetical protein
MARCQFKRGLLSLRECGELTGSLCAGCGRAVCVEHQRHFPAARGGAVACPDCLAGDVDPRARLAQRAEAAPTSAPRTPAAAAVAPTPGAAAKAPNPQDDAVAQARHRYYDDGYYSSGYGLGWHDHDYSAFDPGAAAAGAAVGAASADALDPRDLQDS